MSRMTALALTLAARTDLVRIVLTARRPRYAGYGAYFSTMIDLCSSYTFTYNFTSIDYSHSYSYDSLTTSCFDRRARLSANFLVSWTWRSFSGHLERWPPRAAATLKVRLQPRHL